MNQKFLTVLCTVPDRESALKISRNLVEGKLAACCNIIPGLTSIYSWKEEIQEDDELLIIIKTTGESFPYLEKKILELHPYDVPEIITLPIQSGNKNYLNWVNKNVQK